MSVDVPFPWQWPTHPACPQCGGYHVGPCIGWPRFQYTPNTDPTRPGAQPVPTLTEADVRRIVREELARATGAQTSAGEQSPAGAQG